MKTIWQRSELLLQPVNSQASAIVRSGGLAQPPPDKDRWLIEGELKRRADKLKARDWVDDYLRKR
jgi:hypothetical protein